LHTALRSRDNSLGMSKLGRSIPRGPGGVGDEERLR
jgi:hypothetical protein